MRWWVIRWKEVNSDFGVGWLLFEDRESQSQRFWDSILSPCWRFQRISVGSICKDRPPWMVLDHFVELLAFFGPKRDFPSQLTLHRLGPANFCERKDVVAKYVRLKSCEQTLWRGEGFHRSRYKILSLDSLNCQTPNTFLMPRFQCFANRVCLYNLIKDILDFQTNYNSHSINISQNSSSIFTCMYVCVQAWHFHLSPPYDVLDHTYHIFSESLSYGNNIDGDGDLQKDKDTQTQTKTDTKCFQDLMLYLSKEGSSRL